MHDISYYDTIYLYPKSIYDASIFYSKITKFQDLNIIQHILIYIQLVEGLLELHFPPNLYEKTTKLLCNTKKQYYINKYTLDMLLLSKDPILVHYKNLVIKIFSEIFFDMKEISENKDPYMIEVGKSWSSLSSKLSNFYFYLHNLLLTRIIDVDVYLNNFYNVIAESINDEMNLTLIIESYNTVFKLNTDEYNNCKEFFSSLHKILMKYIYLKPYEYRNDNKSIVIKFKGFNR